MCAFASKGRSPLVLLIDDEQEILQEYSEFFELEGIDCLVCADPVEAVRMVLDQPDIRLVITDRKMERLDGISLIRSLRAKLSPQRRVDFLLLTGDTYSSIEEKDVRVISKPADIGTLLAIIRTCIGPVDEAVE